jgi:hypothetical protein
MMTNSRCERWLPSCFAMGQMKCVFGCRIWAVSGYHSCDFRERQHTPMPNLDAADLMTNRRHACQSCVCKRDGDACKPHTGDSRPPLGWFTQQTSSLNPLTPSQAPRPRRRRTIPP